MKLGTRVGLGPGHIVLGGNPAPPPLKGHSPPIFGPYLLRPNGCMDQDVTWYGDRPRSRQLCVTWGPRIPSPKGGGAEPPKFSAHVYCGQTAGWMKLLLGMEVGLSPGDFMLDGDPVPFPQNGAESPSLIFGPLLLWPNGCMHQNATWYRGRPRPKRLCVRWGSCSPSHKGAQTPQFSAHICCGQMAAWIKTSLGMELGLDPGDFVLDGDPVAPPQKGGQTPKFSACLL